MISEITLAIESGNTVDDLALTIHPHPTLTEAVWDACRYRNWISNKYLTILFKRLRTIIVATSFSNGDEEIAILSNANSRYSNKSGN